MKQWIKRISNAVLFVLLGLLVTACGQSDTVMVRLLTPFDSNPAGQNLMESFALNANPNVIDCEQGQVFAAVKTGQNDTDFATYPIPIRLASTGLPGSAPHYDFASWLQGSSSFPPIQIPVPRGALTGFGVGGAVYASGTLEDSGHCARKVDTAVNPSAALFGHVNAVISEPTSVPINIWVVDANPSPTPAVSVGCGVSVGGGDLLSQQCWNKNYYLLKLSCTGSYCTSLESTYSVVKVEYFINNTGSRTAVQFYSIASSHSGLYVPNIDLIRVSIMKSGDVEGAGILFADKHANWSGAIATATLTNSNDVNLFYSQPVLSLDISRL